MNGRQFPGNWRPLLQEIAFAARHGFQSLQVVARDEGLTAEHLGGDPIVAGAQLRAAGITPVMEIVVFVGAALRSEAGVSALDVLRNNLPAIDALGCACVHLHLAAQKGVPAEAMPDIERQARDAFAAGVALGARHGFRFGFEHNAPMSGRAHPFVGPRVCAETLAQVDGLWLVWDLNHTPADDVSLFEALIPHMSMLHVSDTPLPTVNAHLPIGLGNLDFARHWRALMAGGFAGPAILEIGGLPMSGGYGRDTDEALVDSLRRLSM